MNCRNAAHKRIKARRDFWSLLGSLVSITIICLIIWFASGATGHFWPIWPMLGFAIALLFSGLNAFGPGGRPITDAEIDRVMRKQTGE